jgi:hypothetical protein
MVATTTILLARSTTKIAVASASSSRVRGRRPGSTAAGVDGSG